MRVVEGSLEAGRECGVQKNRASLDPLSERQYLGDVNGREELLHCELSYNQMNRKTLSKKKAKSITQFDDLDSVDQINSSRKDKDEGAMSPVNFEETVGCTHVENAQKSN